MNLIVELRVHRRASLHLPVSRESYMNNKYHSTITLPPTGEGGFGLDTCKDIEILPGPLSADVPNTLTQPLCFFYPNIKHHFSRVPVPPHRTPVSSPHYKLIPVARGTVRVVGK